MTRFVFILCLVSGGLASGQPVQEDVCDDSTDDCSVSDTNMIQFRWETRASANEKNNTKRVHRNKPLSEMTTQELMDYIEALEAANNAQDPTAAPTPSPTANPTPAPTEFTTGVVTAFGDPHLKNVRKESFEVRRAGVHTLLNVPRGAAAVDALLKVDASMEHVGSGCSSVFIRGLDIVGKWLGLVPQLRFAAGGALPGEAGGAVLQVGNSSELSIEEFLSKVPLSMIQLTLHQKDFAMMPSATNKHATQMTATLKLGPGVNMKVSWTSERTKSTSIAHSLWVSVGGLAKVQTTFGGLLGEDDHHDAATPDANCIGTGRSMLQLMTGQTAVVAEASLE